MTPAATICEKVTRGAAQACASAACAVSSTPEQKSAVPAHSRNGAQETIDMTDHHPGASIPVPAPKRKPDHLYRRRRAPADVLAAAGAKMRARRQALGLSLSDVSRALGGIAVVFIADVERGESGVGADIAERWAGVIGLDPAEVLCAFRVIPERAAAAFFDADRMRAALAGGAT